MSAGSATREGCVGGLYEVLVGVSDLDAAIEWFGAFGCRRGPGGHLNASAAHALYGVDSALQSVRLLHGVADHGLVRLVRWATPLNAGLGVAENLRCVGSRWGVRVTANMYNLLNHVERARDSGMPVTLIEPVLAVIGEVTGPQSARPFVDPIVGVREMVLMQPYARNVIFERFGYQSPLYGSVDPSSLLQTSQHTHFGLMIADDDRHLLDFYDRVLGLTRTLDEDTRYDDTTASRRIFGLARDEGYHMVDFDDPRTGPSLAERRSGKLKCVRFAASAKIVDRRAESRAGCIGYSAYTWRTRDIDGMQKRVSAEGGRAVSDVLQDEFGSRSFSFFAPDGYQWLLIEDLT